MNATLLKLRDHFDRQAPLIIFWKGISLVLVVGIIDYLTGYYLSFSIFYLLPIGFVTWFGRKKHAILVSYLSATVWLIADLLTVPQYPHPVIPFWNATLRLGFFLIVNFLLASLKQALQREQQLARQDHLSGVYNSRAFYELAELELERSRRYQHPFTIVYIDLDNFKSVNDRFGHHAGDQLLTVVGKLIKDSIRTVDIAARLGGDEFGLGLAESDRDAARQAIERLREKLLTAMKENGWPVTFSIGMITTVRFPDSLEELVKAADNLMYEVKNNGKNKIKHQLYGVAEREF